MSPFSVIHIDTVVFDVIGTLVDEDAAWASASERIAALAGVNSASDLRHTWMRLLDDRMSAVVSGRAPWHPHQQLVADTASDAIAALGGIVNAQSSAVASVLDREYRAWPDVAAATAALRRTLLVASISNADLDSLARLSNANAISWDLALSTAAVRTFKPAPTAYEYAIDTLRIDPSRALFVASHPWDLRSAREHGFRTAYVARPGAERPSAEDRFDLELADLAELSRLMTDQALPDS
jgi:2-haloacid dehalogenase